MIENYYTSRKYKLMKAFDKSSKNIRLVLNKYYSHEFSENVLRQARKEYETLIPQVPYIGGSQNHMTNDLLESVQMLAFLRVLKAQGKTVVESCEIIYRAMEIRLSRYPRFLLRIIGRLQFTKMFTRRLQRQANESQKGSILETLYSPSSSETAKNLIGVSISLNVGYASFIKHRMHLSLCH